MQLTNSVVTSPPAGVCSIAISVFVCLYVCLLACLKNTSKYHQISVHVSCGRGSVILWRQCNTLCTFGLVDDVMLSHNGVSMWHQSEVRQHCLVEFATWRCRGEVCCLQLHIVMCCDRQRTDHVICCSGWQACSSGGVGVDYS